MLPRVVPPSSNTVCRTRPGRLRNISILDTQDSSLINRAAAFVSDHADDELEALAGAARDVPGTICSKDPLQRRDHGIAVERNDRVTPGREIVRKRSGPACFWISFTECQTPR